LTFDSLICLLDGLFGAAAAVGLVIIRLAPIRAYTQLIRDLDALAEARSRARNDPSLRQLANIARLMECIPRAAAATGGERAPSVTALVRGRRGKLDLLGNFFVRSPAIQNRIDQHLARLRAACVECRRTAAAGYQSPYNPFNLPSSLAGYLGLPLSGIRAIVLDAAAWLAAVVTAAAVAVHA
jgi:hypothetical protein